MAIYLTRIESFSAAHRLNSSKLTAEKNLETYGKCNHPNYHGHNYKVEFTITGSVEESTGMLINISELKNIIQEKVLSVLDHKNLDLDVPFFSKTPSTTENLAIFIWQQMESSLPSGVVLYKIKVWETDNNIVEYTGE